MICPECGYDNKKPIGKANEDIEKGKFGDIELNENGKRMLPHKSKCKLQMKGVELDYTQGR